MLHSLVDSALNGKMWNFIKKTPQTLANSKIMRTFAPVFEKHLLNTTKDGPFVYRLGRKIFILERGVRFSHGLPKKGYPRNRVTLFLFRKNFTTFAGKHI